MNEPLAPDPRWRRAQDNASYPWQTDTGSTSIHSPPQAYAQGFENGAYALANHLIRLLRKSDGSITGESVRLGTREMIALLTEYNRGNAHPARGWEHEPKRS